MIILTLFAAIVLYGSYVGSTEPQAKITAYQPYHEDVTSIIVHNRGELPMSGFYITETDYVVWSDNQLKNFENDMKVFPDQTFIIEGMPCGWDMKYDMKVTFLASQAETDELPGATWYNVPASCDEPIWWKVP